MSDLGGSVMVRLTGTVTAGDHPQDGAYVQLRNLRDDFQAEVRTGADGRFTLYPVPGRWRLVSFAPRTGRAEREVGVGDADVDVVLQLP